MVDLPSASAVGARGAGETHIILLFSACMRVIFRDYQLSTSRDEIKLEARGGLKPETRTKTRSYTESRPEYKPRERHSKQSHKYQCQCSRASKRANEREQYTVHRHRQDAALTICYLLYGCLQHLSFTSTYAQTTINSEVRHDIIRNTAAHTP